MLRVTLYVSLSFMVMGSSCQRPKDLNKKLYEALKDKPELRKKECLEDDHLIWDSENAHPKQPGGGCYLKTFFDYC